MLLHLSIRDYVLIDEIKLDFQSGFTVLTGETGAGKSILIDALELLLGGRADVQRIRHGCERAEISAEFDIRNLPPLQQWLQENALDDQAGSCLLRRVIDTSGRSRNFINGMPGTLQQLRTAGEWLIDIHGQHAHQTLLRIPQQAELLDGWAGETRLVKQVASAYQHWQIVRQQRLDWERNSSRDAGEREQLTWQVKELSDLNFSVEDWQRLQGDHNRLAHTAKLLEAAQFSLESLSENEMAALTQIDRVSTRLHSVIEIDSTLAPISEQLQSIEAQLQDVIYELRHYQQHLDLDPQRLEAIEARLLAIHGVSRKYRVHPEELPELLAAATQQLTNLEIRADGTALADAEQVAQQEYTQLAQQLSDKRHEAATSLARRVTENMQMLAMEGGRFQVALHPVTPGNQSGLEQIEFQVSAHKDMPLRPLHKVASGGELSRIGLAIQVIASQAGMAPTLIFDEVDAGIGGSVAEKIGKLLKVLGETRQVLCITHLPQVAAMGDHHWQVSKKNGQQADQTLISRIHHLDQAGRIDEIARMLGGEKLTATTRKHAKEMLGDHAALK
ncbi:MAG: transporter:DNA repair protein RecN [Pseudomonadota bacterium]|jgi:DNA repair protein RecN (Recombination protein N)|nr:DNA repair protein RecN [Nitrosomonas sp.]